MRLFFATFPEGETRRLIASAASALSLDDDARRVRCENYHITLAFAGEVSGAQLASLRTIGLLDVPPFTVRFDIYEHWQRSEVVVIAASECPSAMRDLHCKLRGELVNQNIASDPMPFRPHVTIARKAAQAPEQQEMSGFHWQVTAFQLVRSVRSDAGSVYTVLDRWSLLDKRVYGQ